ncbi:MAG: PilZ domain-containing protein [Candidatus Eremiobacteraeota bacterium]|nr:PilZ domain-containing protein [Candidatus Eremiobacteraeota bacterium]MCW5866093.1 PilZ domain-containing protein [Candidatus Eremiobacteraeota bacterium]
MNFRSRFLNWLRAWQGPTLSEMERRQPGPRQPLTIAVHCRHNGKEFQARVLDFSPQGLKLECSRRLQVEDTLEIDSLDHRQHVSGRIAWVQGAQVGVQFNPSDENIIGDWLTLAAISQSA